MPTMVGRLIIVKRNLYEARGELVGENSRCAGSLDTTSVASTNLGRTNRYRSNIRIRVGGERHERNQYLR